MKTRVFTGHIITPNEIIENGFVVIENGIITEIVRAGEQMSVSRSNVEYIDGYILPGLVDIHNHGGAGFDYMDVTEEAFDGISTYLASHGVTSALCTSVSAPVPALEKFLDFFRIYQEKNHNGCHFLGVHLEGPYLSIKNKGAHPENALLIPSSGYEFVLKNADAIRLVTLAPELPGAEKMIADLTAAGIVVSGGHDDGLDFDIINGIRAGMNHSTHIYCAMSTLVKRNNKRYCGLCEVSMTEDRLTTEMIADNHHVPPILAKMIYRCKGADRVCLVSDCLRLGGMPEDDSVYYLGASNNMGQPVKVRGGVAILLDESHFAGSVQSLDRMIANVVRDAEIPLIDAVKMASHTPARVIGVDDQIGSIHPGKRADFCMMDSNFNVTKTIIGGKVVYSGK